MNKMQVKDSGSVLDNVLFELVDDYNEYSRLIEKQKITIQMCLYIAEFQALYEYIGANNYIYHKMMTMADKLGYQLRQTMRAETHSEAEKEFRYIVYEIEKPSNVDKKPEYKAPIEAIYKQLKIVLQNSLAIAVRTSSDIQANTRLYKDGLICDDLDKLEVIGEVERAFNVALTDDDIDTVETVMDLARCIAKALERQENDLN